MKCGRLVLDQDQAETDQFAEVIEKYGEPNQKRLYRRTDGKIMIRPCGMGADYSLMPHCIGWTGAAVAVYAVLGIFIWMPAPLAWLAGAYAWNVAGAFVVSRNMLSAERRRLLMLISIFPAALLCAAGYVLLALYLYWNVFFPPRS
jgi:hypothetical protein